MTRPGGLGRGLGALIPAGEMRTTAISTGLQEVLVTAIVPNPNQPRAYFDDEALGHLADSIKELGVLQPLLVRQLAPPIRELRANSTCYQSSLEEVATSRIQFPLQSDH